SLSADPRRYLRQKDIEKEPDGVFRPAPPIIAKDVEIELIGFTPMAKFLVGRQTAQLDRTPRNHVFVLVVDVAHHLQVVDGQKRLRSQPRGVEILGRWRA